MNSLKLLIEETPGGIVRIDLDGFLDAHNFEKLEAVFEKHFAEGHYRFIVDVSRLTYVSSSGAGVFVGAASACQDHNGNIVLVRPTPEVQEIFELLGVYQIFPVVKEREQALAQF